MEKVIRQARHTLEMVKFSHSIFALPFALSSLFFASNGFPSLKNLALIILSMVFARNTAMSFNRLVDASIDAQNPRTSIRHLPQGLLSKTYVSLFTLSNALLFIWITHFFNPLAFYLSPLALFIICFYSFTKRFSHFTQIFLGLSLGIAPIGAWIAIQGKIELFPIILGSAVLFWVAGFDLLYSIQDYEFDKKHGLKSLVVKFGIKRSLLIARIFHILTIITFFILGMIYHLGIFYWGTILLMSFCFIYEHSLLKPNDLSKINAAFFTVNGFVGVLFLFGSMAQVISSH